MTNRSPNRLLYTSLITAAVSAALAGPAGVVEASAAVAGPRATAQQAGGGQGNQQRQQGPRPYTEVVPADATTDVGLFSVHRTDENLLFEIPDTLFGRELLLISRIARVPAGLGGFAPAGYKAGEQVLTFQRNGNRVLLRKRSYEQVAPDSSPISISVVNNNFEPIIASFPVAAIGPESTSVVIDVTSFYEGDTPAISGLSSAQRSSYGVRRLDPARSFINFARSFPQNVDVRHTMTYEATSPPENASTNTLSMEMHQSMVLLPRDPMRPRYADDRVGFFSVQQVNFGLDVQKAGEQRFIRRWRLEPSDPAAYARGELVEPVKPIVWYLDPATPTRYRECVRTGVEAWNGPFETAGFRNAVRALDPPSPAQDPEWDMADVRNSVVRWAASLTRNAQGPSVSDPRTGEIIESDIVWYHNHMRSYRNRIMIETGAANPRARSLPIDETLMCDAMRQVIAHEIGHALGLPHNMISSSAYPVDSLRVKSFAARMGVAPTIMDYARQNYVAQPGDGLEGTEFLRQIGPYDHYVINWGYRVLPDAATPEAERVTLNRWVAERAGDRRFKFLPQGLGPDPRAQTEDIGDDAVRASTFGIMNLRRVIPELVEWTTKPGEDYTDLAELYGEAIGQWNRLVGHVVNQIGGTRVDLKVADQSGAVFSPVPRAHQERALAFLAEQVFEAPTWLLDDDILQRIGDAGGFQQLSARQAAVLNGVLNTARLGRLAENEVMARSAAWPVVDYLEAVRQAVWRDPAATAGDPYRRALQRAHIDRLGELLEDAPEPTAAGGRAGGPGGPDLSRLDIRPLIRAQLVSLRSTAEQAQSDVEGAVERAHLADIVERIGNIL